MAATLLRWSWRDLRGRWLQVLATALILGLGIGTFAGLVGIREWRERSADESFAAMRADDLRVDLAGEGYVPSGRLEAAVSPLLGSVVGAAEERLVANGQLDASRPGRPLMVPARIVGLPLPDGGQSVDRLAVHAGRGLLPTDAGRRVAVLDSNFARHFDLGARGRVRIAGLGAVPYVGHGVTPSYVLVVDETGFPGAEASLGIVYLPIAAAQRAAGQPGAVNELVLRVADGVGVARAEHEVRRALAAALPRQGMTIARGADEDSRAILYRDARNDQKMFLVLAILVLAGAVFAVFNLVSRAVEAQRREIGIGMALGAPPWLLALRPLLLGLQIALLGILLGLPVGALASAGFRSVYEDFYPLPVYADVFPLRFFLFAAALGLALPLLAAALPVARAVGVAPVEGIRVGFRAAGRGGAARFLRRLRVPGHSLAQLPPRNLARGLRRTLLTVLGLGAAMTITVATLAVFDGFRGVVDRQEVEVLHTGADRVEATLTSPEPAGGPVQRQVAALPEVKKVDADLVVPARVAAGEHSLEIALTAIRPGSTVWRPTLTEGSLLGGVVLARKAAEDLGVGVGDEVLLSHPRWTGSGYEIARSPVPVSGIHANPVRSFAYVDAVAAARLGGIDLTNELLILPARGIGAAELQRALFGRPGIGAVRPARASVEAIHDALESTTSIFGLIAAITLLMAILVAFTSTSVSVDEHRREYATMFAFGLPPRAGLRVAMSESLVTGVLGTVLGLGLGLAVAAWMVTSLLADTAPDLDVLVEISALSLALIFFVGVVSVTLAPLFLYRRLRGMDVSATLRVME
ncbi:MAG TPA: FtsX-like permease family protein [Solirubrobacterales bacterium]|nr:FtsX-like permease family protein [Solirubrobacterales bacterium]